jgi:xanthine dehydrogenase accessory factor
MKSETLLALNTARREGRAIVRATDLASGEERLLIPRTDTSPLGIAATAAARADTSGVAEIDGHKWFLAVYNPPLDVVIVGAVHIAQFLGPMAIMAGFKVRIVDPRTGFATPERFPDTRLVREWPDEALAKEPLSERSAVVMLTHDPKLDDPALIVALRSKCFYVGALGSKKSQAARRERLRAQGFDDETLARIHGPVGLNIGARSPAEIAISIIAEITLNLRGPKP